MDPFSPTAIIFLAQAAAPEAAQAAATAIPGKAVGILALGQVVVILSYWIASRLVAHEEGRFLRAILVYVSYTIGFIVLAFAAGIAFGMTYQAYPIVALAIAGVAFLLFVALLFQVPMKTYRIGFGAAFGFLILSLILSTAGNLVITRTLGGPAYLRDQFTLPAEQRTAIWSFVEKYIGRKPRPSPEEMIAADPAKPLEERQAALQGMYRALQERHASLTEGDQQALDAYKLQLARYQELVEKLKAAQQ
jgi:hypothetical protein